MVPGYGGLKQEVGEAGRPGIKFPKPQIHYTVWENTLHLFHVFKREISYFSPHKGLFGSFFLIQFKYLRKEL